MRPAVSSIPYDTSSKEKTVNVITLAQFEEGNLSQEYSNDTESGDESDDGSNLSPLISEAEIDAISSYNEFDSEPMSMGMLEDICGGSQYHLSINRRWGRYKIRDRFKKRRAEWKGALLPTQNMGKVLHKVFKAVVNELPETLPILG